VIMPAKKNIIDIAKVCRAMLDKTLPDAGDYSGWCAFVSVVLWQVLKHYGYRPKLIKGSYNTGPKRDYNAIGCGAHAWVECNGQILDLSATQFGRRNKVYIPPEVIMKKYYSSHWNKEVPSKKYLGWAFQGFYINPSIKKYDKLIKELCKLIINELERKNK
jgi:hypothetical protein